MGKNRYLVILVFIVFYVRVFTNPYVTKSLDDKNLGKHEELDIHIPSDTFETIDDSSVYISLSPNENFRTTISNPEVVGRYNFIYATSILYEDDYLYIGDEKFGLHILDVKSMDNVKYLGFYDFQSTNMNGEVESLFLDSASQRLYCSIGSGIIILSVENKNQPILLDHIEGGVDNSRYVSYHNDVIYVSDSRGLVTVSEGGEVLDVFQCDAMYHIKMGEYIYVADDTTKGFRVVVDGANSTNLTSDGDFYGDVRVYSLFFLNDVIYIPDRESAGNVLIYNVSDPLNPIKAGGVQGLILNNDMFHRDLFVEERECGSRLLYISKTLSNGASNSHFSIYNITNFHDTKLLSRQYVWGTNAVFTGLAFDSKRQLAFLSGQQFGIEIYNCSDPTNPVLVDYRGKHNGQSSVRSILEGQYLYVADEMSGVKMYDVRDPNEIVLTNEFETWTSYSASEPQIHSMRIFEEYILVLYTFGLVVYNKTSLEHIYNDTFSESLNEHSDFQVVVEEEDVIRIYVIGDYVMYIFDFSIEDGSFMINQAYPSFLQNARDLYVLVEKKLILVACQSTGLVIIDASDFPSMAVAGTVRQGINAQQVTVDESQTLAYVTDIDDGLKIINISSMVLIGDIDTNKATNVEVQGSVAVVADGEDGVSFIDVSDPVYPLFITIVSTFNAKHAHLRDNFVYVSDGEYGIKIIRGDFRVQGSRDTFDYFCGDTVLQVVGEDCFGRKSPTQTLNIHRDDYCSGHGVCRPDFKCACIGLYESDDCGTWKCGSFEFTDYKKTCSGNGKCINPNECVCDSNYRGAECGVNTLYVSVVTPLVSMFGVFSLTTLCLCCCTCAIFCCCCFFVISLSAFFLVSTVLKQKINLRKFGRLKNFDLYLKEQELESDTSIAHLRINKSLFEISFDEIEIDSIIGEGGSNSVVFRSTWGGKLVAFKCFKTRLLMTDQDKFDEFEKEVQLLSSLSHPNIVTFYGASLKPPRVGIVMELCENGEILQYMIQFRERSLGIRYPLRKKLIMIGKVVNAIAFLHSKNIIHRDIKAENILVTSLEEPKVMDFGLSRLVDRMSIEKTARIGTSVYMAPEIVLSDRYDEKCDVFSFSILFWILIVEDDHPYPENPRVEFRVANDPSFRPSLDPIRVFVGESGDGKQWILDILEKCWDHDPSKRYSFDQLREIWKERGDINSFSENYDCDDNNNLGNNFGNNEEEASQGGFIVEETSMKEYENRGRKELIWEISSLKKALEESKRENEKLRKESGISEN